MSDGEAPRGELHGTATPPWSEGAGKELCSRALGWAGRNWSTLRRATLQGSPAGQGEWRISTPVSLFLFLCPLISTGQAEAEGQRGPGNTAWGAQTAS